MSNTYDIAVVGATGLVGRQIIQILEERKFPVGRLYPLASERSAGSLISFNHKDEEVEVLDDFDFGQVHLALFSAGGPVSAKFAPKAADAGAVVIDNTSYFRNDEDIPLVIPEVNIERIADYKERRIIANPNCSTIQMLVALKPIYDAVGIQRINVATYQAVSGAGRSALIALSQDSMEILNSKQPENRGEQKLVAFNAVPQIAEFLDTGYTGEEMKMIWETQKILEDQNIMINPTCVRIPVYYGHSEAVHIETRKKITVSQARKLLDSSPGIRLMDDWERGEYPTAGLDAAHRDEVFVGRIREDLSHPLGLDLWVVSDNLRKGAALNSVQIAEILVDRFI